MLRFRKSQTDDDARFCDRCSSVCDRRCQAEALRQRTFDQLVRNGWRLA